VLSLDIQCALEREVVGQSRAVRTLARALTISRSGLGHQGGAAGVYLFLGPTGTGKTHFAHVLARIVHGDARRLAVVDCASLGEAEDWSRAAAHVAAQLGAGAGTRHASGSGPIVLIEHLESARPEFVRWLLAALESGSVTLPDGESGSLRGCLVLLTSNLCAREIYGEDRQVGFSPATELEESEKARIFQLCSTAAERRWGTDLLTHIDDLVVFHRLRKRHLPFILRRLMRELNRQLTARAVRCELSAAAMDFLVERADRFLAHGAWYLVKVYRRFVVFPLADLLTSGRLPAGSAVDVELEESDRLCFRVTPGAAAETRGGEASARLQIPVAWNDGVLARPLID
jgi:ATP-dependent Clp protease ATP-binding subunit ClpA